MKECKNEKDNCQLSTVNCQLPPGTRPATEEELWQLSAFRQSLIDAPETKPYMREKYRADIINHLSILYVSERTGIIHLCVDRDGKPERITEFMIDYYDSYATFYKKLNEFFDTTKLTFQI